MGRAPARVSVAPPRRSGGRERGRRRDVADPLAAVPPARFVREPDALAAELRRAGRTQEAAELARRHRPAVVPWVVNRLARTAPEEIRALLDAADRLRRAYGRDPGGIAGATAHHREALQALARRAEK